MNIHTRVLRVYPHLGGPIILMTPGEVNADGMHSSDAPTLWCCDLKSSN
jgi:hypothetical protein